MKIFFKVVIIIILIISVKNLSAQADHPIPTPLYSPLFLNPSPKLTGLGMSGTSLPNEDPSGFYYNPAQLGYIGQTNNISFQFYPSASNSLGINTVGYNNKSFNIGYNFEKLLNGFKLSAGLGYIHSNFDYNYYFSEPAFPLLAKSITHESLDAYGMGVGIDYFVQFNFGITYKNIYWKLSASQNNTLISNDNNTSYIDYGFLLTVPVIRLINPRLQFSPYGNAPAFPYLNLSIGYARLNINDGIFYSDPAYANPMLKTARLGYTISTGVNISLNNSKLKALSYDFTADAEDNLIVINPETYASYYQGFLGDIKIGRNLFELKSDDNVVVHKGHNINFFETLSFQIGRFGGGGYSNDKSSGFCIQSKGVFTLLKGFTKNNIFDFIAGHLDIQYYSSKLSLDSGYETKFEGINIIWSGMML